MDCKTQKVNKITLTIMEKEIQKHYDHIYSETKTKVILISLYTSLATSFLYISQITLFQNQTKDDKYLKLLAILPRALFQIFLLFKTNKKKLSKKLLFTYLYLECGITIYNCRENFSSVGTFLSVINMFHGGTIIFRFVQNYLYKLVYFLVFSISCMIFLHYEINSEVYFGIFFLVFICLKEYYCMFEIKKSHIRTFATYDMMKTQTDLMEYINTGLAIVDEEQVYFHNDRIKRIFGVNRAQEIIQVLENIDVEVNENSEYEVLEGKESNEVSNRFVNEIHQTEVNELITERINLVQEDSNLRKGKTKLLRFLKKSLEKTKKKSKLKVRIHNNILHNRVYEIFGVPVSHKGKPCILIGIVDETIKNHKIFLEDSNNYKDNLLAYISHNLKTPLNHIFMFLQSQKKWIDQMYKEERDNFRDKKDFFNMAMSGVKNLLGLTEDIQIFTEISNGELKIEKSKLDLESMCKEVKKTFKKVFRNRGIQFQINASEINSESIYTSKVRLKQILVHLIKNSLKHTSKGYIALELKEKEGKKLEVKVRDTGCGISQEKKKKLISKIHQPYSLPSDLADKKSSFSLGLIICHHLAKILAPEDEESPFVINSQEGMGTEIILMIDIKKPRNSNFTFKRNKGSLLKEVLKSKRKVEHFDECLDFISDSSRNSPSVRRRKLNFTKGNNKPSSHRNSRKTPRLNSNKEERKKNFFDPKTFSSTRYLHNLTLKPCDCVDILLVDDDDFNTSILSNILEKEGYTTKKTYNGKEALDFLESNCQEGHRYSDNCKLVITDINMPIMDGRVLAKILNGRMKAKKISYLTIFGCTANVMEEKSDYGDFSDMIGKPIKKIELVELVKGVFENKEKLVKLETFGPRPSLVVKETEEDSLNRSY